MAKFSNTTAKLVLLFSFLLIIALAESRVLLGSDAGKSTPICGSVYGAQSGDTCAAVAQLFNLSDEFFSAINPNLNCNSIFVGQWLCVDGTA